MLGKQERHCKGDLLEIPSPVMSRIHEYANNTRIRETRQIHIEIGDTKTVSPYMVRSMNSRVQFRSTNWVTRTQEGSLYPHA